MKGTQGQDRGPRRRGREGFVLFFNERFDHTYKLRENRRGLKIQIIK